MASGERSTSIWGEVDDVHEMGGTGGWVGMPAAARGLAAVHAASARSAMDVRYEGAPGRLQMLR